MSSNPFLKDHDGEWLEITVISDSGNIMKLSLVYSIAYQIATFYFMVYTPDSIPLSAEQIYSQYLERSTQSNLKPSHS